MPGESPSQPGWYPDQNGAMRWFDGASWTDHVQPGAGAPAGGAEPTMVQPGTPEPTRPLAQQPGWSLPPDLPPVLRRVRRRRVRREDRRTAPCRNLRFLVVLPVLVVPAGSSRRRRPAAATRVC